MSSMTGERGVPSPVTPSDDSHSIGEPVSQPGRGSIVIQPQTGDAAPGSLSPERQLTRHLFTAEANEEDSGLELTINDPGQGIVGLVEGWLVDEAAPEGGALSRDASPAVRLFKEAAHAHLAESFDPAEPEDSMALALYSGQKALEPVSPPDGPGGAKHPVDANQAVAAGLIKFFGSPENPQAVIGALGPVRIDRHPIGGTLETLHSEPTPDSNHFASTEGGNFDASVVRVVPVRPGDRFVVSSGHVVGFDKNQMRNKDFMAALRQPNPNRAAKKLIKASQTEGSKRVIVTDYLPGRRSPRGIDRSRVYDKQPTESKLGRLAFWRGERDSATDTGRRRGVASFLGKSTLGALIARGTGKLPGRRKHQAEHTGQTPTTSRRRWDPRERLYGMGVRGHSYYVQKVGERQDKRRQLAEEQKTWTDQQRADWKRHHRVRRGVGLLGGLAVGALLAYGTYKFGERSVFDFGDGLDEGTDALPNWFSDDGAHDAWWNPLRGTDFNPWNENNVLNDDPIRYIAQPDKTEGPDFVPAFIDGDNFDVWSGDAPFFKNLLGDEEEIMRAVPGSDESGKINVPTPPNDGSGEGQLTPPREDQPPAGPAADDLAIPHRIRIENGQGLQHLEHIWGHELRGSGFTGLDAAQIDIRLQDALTSDSIRMADTGESALYRMPDGRWGFADTGNVVIDEEFRRLAERLIEAEKLGV